MPYPLLALAAGEVPSTDWSQYGIAGIIAGLGIWFFFLAYRQMSARYEAERAEVKRLNQLIQDKYVPALEAATQVLHEVVRFLERERDRRRDGEGRDRNGR